MRVKTQAKMMRSQEFRVETFLLFGFVFFKAGSHESLKWPGTPYVHQVGLEFRDLPTSVPQVLELKAWTTMPGTEEKLVGRVKETVFSRKGIICVKI